MRRFIAASLAVALVAAIPATVLISPAAADPPTGGTVVVDETFTGTTVPDPAWIGLGQACLSGAAAGSTPGPRLQTCDTQRQGPVPAIGVTPGYLQLTDAGNNEAGAVLYNRPIPATAGLSLTFEQYQYGGTGADGIGFFLVDGATELTQTGASGGSLGYAQKFSQQGLRGGYVGVGLDAFGNYYDDGEGRGKNCPPDQQSPSDRTGPVAPNVITIRGPGSGLNGYCYLSSTTDPASNPNSPTSTLPGRLRAPANTTDPAQAKRTVNVQVTPEPNPRIIVQIDFNDGNGWQEVLNQPAPANPPSTYKFGFSSATGGSTDIHLIRNVQVRTINDLDVLQIVKQVDRSGAPLPAVITAGTTIPYQYVVTNGGLEPLSALSVTDDRITGVTCDATTLPPQPDPAGTTVCRGSYVVTDADAAAGSVTNNASGTAQVPGGATVTSNTTTVTVPLVASLSVAKDIIDQGPYAVGEQVQYSYTVTNTGGATVSTVAVADNRAKPGTVTCLATSLDPAQSTTCTTSIVIASGDLAADGSLTNTATATGTTPIGQPVTSGPATKTIPVGTDVAVTKSADTTTPAVGQQVSFTVTATNNGPGPAEQAVINDLLPTGLTLVSATPSAGSYNSSNGNWSIDALAVKASATLTLVATVDSGATVTNAATLTSLRQPDTNPANNSDSVTLNPVVPTTDIAVTKAVDQPSVRVGQQATFTLTATNNGPFPATGITVTDTLPSLLAFVSAGAGYDEPTGIWTVGDLAVGESRSVQITVRATAVGSFDNTAGLSTVSPQDVNEANDVDSAELTVTPALADLQLVKGLLTSPRNVQVGDTVTYSIVVTNAGPDAVPDAVVTEEFPDGLTVLSTSPSQGTVAVPSYTWSVGALAPGASAELSISARVDTVGTKVNRATVGSATVDDPDPSNNTESATFTGSPTELDLAVTKTRTGPEQVILGQPVSFTVGVVNNGPADATNVVLFDKLPAGLTFSAASAPAGTTYNQADGTWSIPLLANGSTLSLTLTATASDPGAVVNTASLEYLDQTDTNPTNNEASAPVEVIELADLAITKSVAPSVAQPGDTVTYTVTVINNGPNAAQSVQVTDPLRKSVDITGNTPSQGTFDPETGVWDVGTLAPEATASLTYQVRVAEPGTVLNTAVITQSSVPDPNLDNNRAEAVLEVPSADLAVSKSVDNAAPTVGQQVTFTITASNLGPDGTTTAQVTDPLPAGLSFVSSNPSVGTYDAATGIWTIGALGVDDPAVTLQVVALVTATGAHQNQATIAAVDGPIDPNSANNTGTVTIDATPQPADLAAAKTVQPQQVKQGGQATFSLTATNLGPGVATGATLTDTLPDGLSVVAAPTGCTVDGQRIVCPLGDLAVGAVGTVTVDVRADGSGSLRNTVTVSGTAPNPQPVNDTAVTTLTVTPTPEPTPEPPTPPTPPTSGGGGTPGGGTGPTPGPVVPTGDLPTTGVDLATPLSWAALFILAGTVLLLVARARRRPPESPSSP